MIAPPPVAVVSCAVTLQGNTRQSGGVDITYVNNGTTVLHHVTFDVGYHTIDADISRTVEDTGTFSPGATISHHFDAFSGVSWLGYQTTSCAATDAR